MSSLLIILAIVLGIVGIIGSIVPGIPGPPLSWLGMVLMYFVGGTNHNGDPMSITVLLIWLAVTTVVTILDYVVPSMFTKITGGSKYAGRGAIAGMIVGMIVPPIGIIVGAILGAFLSEMYYASKSASDSATSALGALLGFFLGTGMKLVVTGLMLYHIIDFI